MHTPTPRPTTDACFMTGRIITVGVRRDWAILDTDFCIDAGSLDAPQIIAAGSWQKAVYDTAMFPGYPSGAMRHD